MGIFSSETPADEPEVPEIDAAAVAQASQKHSSEMSMREYIATQFACSAALNDNYEIDDIPEAAIEYADKLITRLAKK